MWASNDLRFVRTHIFDGQLKRHSLPEQLRIEEALAELEAALFQDRSYGTKVGDGRAAPIDLFGVEFLVYFKVIGNMVHFCAVREAGHQPNDS